MELPFVENEFKQFDNTHYVPTLTELDAGVQGTQILSLLCAKAAELHKDKKVKEDYYPSNLWFCYHCVRRGNMFFVAGTYWTQSAKAHRYFLLIYLLSLYDYNIIPSCHNKNEKRK